MGIVGAGKSTFAENLALKVYGKILASDEIRRDFVNRGIIPKKYDSKYNNIVFDEMHKQIDECAKAGQTIIVDSTNVPASSRKPIIEIAQKYGYKVTGELLLIDDEESEKRVIQRQEKEGRSSHYIEDIHLAIKIYKQRLFEGWPKLEEGFHEINTYQNGKIIKKEQRPLIATSNLGKMAIYAQIFDEFGVQYCSLRDLKVDIEIEENGETELENAMIKAKSYHEVTGLPVLANDSGLIIEKFAPEDQPGVFVRRYGGRELTDQETINIFSKKLTAVGGASDSSSMLHLFFVIKMVFIIVNCSKVIVL